MSDDKQADKAEAIDERAERELDALLGQASRDPALVEGARVDWPRLQREDPAAFARKWPEYQQRMAMLQGVRQSRAAVGEELLGERRAREIERLGSLDPELAD